MKQNHLIRYCLGIHKRAHISNILRALEIVDIETMYYMEICTVIKLMHRHPITKTILNECRDKENNDCEVGSLIMIDKMGTLIDETNEYVLSNPDAARNEIRDKYLYYQTDDNEINEIVALLNNYNYNNRKKLNELTMIKPIRDYLWERELNDINIAMENLYL